jgi:hypothetical protein
MRNNRLTTKTTDDRLNRPNYDSIPFKNKDIDRSQRKSAEQDAKREAIRLGKEKAKRVVTGNQLSFKKS